MTPDRLKEHITSVRNGFWAKRLGVAKRHPLEIRIGVYRWQG